MKLAIGITAFIITVIAIIMVFQLLKYFKKHAQEDVEVHRKYIMSRIIMICALGTILSLIGMLELLIK